MAPMADQSRIFFGVALLRVKPVQLGLFGNRPFANRTETSLGYRPSEFYLSPIGGPSPFIMF
jgi:hypothetical protein